MTPLERLEKWSRKYYTYTIHSGPHLGWGEEYVRLRGGSRTVVVDNADVVGMMGEDSEPTIEDVITAALDKWEADTSEKGYVVWYRLDPEDGSPMINHKINRVEVTATSESAAWAEAEKVVRQAIGDDPAKIVPYGRIRER